MVDTLTTQERSWRMSLVKGMDTKPEMLVRRMVHAMGFRYRLRVKDLPGKPDLVFPRLGKVIFVHGCFWHRHHKASCPLARLPKSRLEFWEAKLEGNRTRDLRNKRQLRSAGWSVLEVWECEMKNTDALAARLRYFLDRTEKEWTAMLHIDNFNIELFNALHPETKHPAATKPPKPAQAQLHLKRLDPKLKLAIDVEAKLRGQRLNELVPELLRLGLQSLQQGKAPGDGR